MFSYKTDFGSKMYSKLTISERTKNKTTIKSLEICLIKHTLILLLKTKTIKNGYYK